MRRAAAFLGRLFETGRDPLVSYSLVVVDEAQLFSAGRRRRRFGHDTEEIENAVLGYAGVCLKLPDALSVWLCSV